MATAEANDQAETTDVDVEHDEHPLIRPVRLDAIRLDGGTQLRVSLKEGTVDEYAKVFKAGKELPPPDVYFDGTHYWPADGHQRIAAASKAGRSVIYCNIHPGERRDAILHAVGANASHGDRRTQADARNAVATMLKDEEWGKLKDREIARRCGVTHPTVASVRRELNGKSFHSGAAVGPVSDDPSSPDSDEPPDVQADDPPDVAEGRRNATIPVNAVVEVTEPEWKDCETAGTDGPVEPPAELTDEEWLATLPAREHLAEHVRARFDREALAWRATKAIREEFGRQMRPHLRQLDRDQKGYRSIWRSETESYLQMNDPSRWEACKDCDGTVQVPLFDYCAACMGDGYRLGVPIAPRRKRKRPPVSTAT